MPVPRHSRKLLPTVLGRGSWPEASRLANVLRQETVGGALLLVATVVALIWANSPVADSYLALRDTVVGPSALHLDLTIGQWASDGLLAIFFFVAGLELKREFVAGDLSDPRRAAVPIAAAVGGMLMPAVIYTAVNLLTSAGAGRGWAVPTATDIAFALAVLAVISTHLPSAMRTFLLTLAVVDDLLAITVIAVFFTAELQLGLLALALIPLGLFAVAVQRRVRSIFVLLPLALLVWGLVHASGIHATVAGVLLGFTVPVLRSKAAGGPDAGPGLAEHLEHRIRPLSAGIAVPVFAFFAAGVSLGGWSGFTSAIGDPITIGIVLALVVGKAIGITGATYLAGRITGQSLADRLSWWDVLALAVLGGIGFTVSLLVAELAFGVGTAANDHAKVGVLLGSLVAALLAAVLLRIRNKVYRAISAEEQVDADADGIPDVYADDSSDLEGGRLTEGDTPASGRPAGPPPSAPEEIP